MPTPLRVVAKTANQATAIVCGGDRTELRLVDQVMRVAQALWPRKTAAELALRTGNKTRACEYWLERRSGMSGEALAALLRSDEGFQVLEAIIGDAKPVWWRAFKRSVKRSELRRQQRAIQKALDEEEQGDLWF